MSNSKNPLSPEVKRLLLNKLPDILTCEADDVLPLLQCNPQAFNRLAEAFERMTLDSNSTSTDSLRPGSREWLGHTMAGLPIHSVYADQFGALSIKPTSDTSLRYLLMDYMPHDRTVTNKGVLNRERLCMLLYDQLTVQGKERYGQIAKWRANIGLSDDYCLQGDVAIARYAHLVESLFFQDYALLEIELRARLNLPKDQPTVIQYIEPLAKSAQTMVFTRLERYIVLAPTEN